KIDSLSESPTRLWKIQILKCLLTKKLIYSEIVIAIYMQITCDSIVKILTVEREKSDFVYELST
ncbi:MAG TPA: hypothetical protein VGO47_05090, partial [Chlamydiales bacterium]|nr:hypothetical protein [Chlamydiales bacterium]